MLVSLFFIAFSLGNEIQRCIAIITGWLMSRKSIRVSRADIKSQSFFLFVLVHKQAITTLPKPN